MSCSIGSRVAAALFAALFIAQPLTAQATGPLARQLAGIVAPSDVRLASGRPGPRYWQQRADYRIDATLDPVTRDAARQRAHHLSQQCAREPAVSLDARRAEHLCAGEPHQPAQPAAARLPGHRVRLLLSGIQRRAGARVGEGERRRRDVPRHRHDACASISRGRLPPAARSPSTSCGTSTCRPMARDAWATTARSTRSGSGIRAWPSTTT